MHVCVNAYPDDLTERDLQKQMCHLRPYPWESYDILIALRDQSLVLLLNDLSRIFYVYSLLVVEANCGDEFIQVFLTSFQDHVNAETFVFH